MKQIQHLISNKKTLYLLAVFILFSYFIPYFIYGKEIYLVQYDNLDSVILYFKILVENHMAFSPNTDIVPNMMNGLPRVSYPGELSFLFLLYILFEPFTAYVINDILIHTIAFCGMFILVEKYIITDKTSKWRYFYVFIPSIAFALVPFWSHGGLSVAGQPLALYAFLNIRKGDYSLKNWIILIALPFYSSLILSFIFFLFAMGTLWVYDIIHKKKINFGFVGALILMSTMYLIVEYRLIYEMFIHHSFISHRIEFDLRQTFTFDSFYKASHIRFLNGMANNIPLHYQYTLPFILITMLISSIKRRLGSKENFLLLFITLLLYIFSGWDWLLASKYSLPLLLLFSLILYLISQKKILPFLLIVQILLAYWAEFWFSPWWNQFIDSLPLLKSFHFSRLVFISVTLWYLMLALAITEFTQKIKYSFIWLILLLLFQVNLAYTWKTFGDSEWGKKKSYNKYYSTELFDQIAKYIGENKHTYRVISLGIEPAISLYNGFYTVDGYSTNYPLEYKQQFRSIIADYLNTIPPHLGDNHAYNDWGSKVYLLQPNCPSTNSDNNRTRFAKDLNFDTRMLYCMGARYIFSAYEIKNSETLGLIKMKTFYNKNTSIWTITLYRIDDTLLTPQKCDDPLLPSFNTNKKRSKYFQIKIEDLTHISK